MNKLAVALVLAFLIPLSSGNLFAATCPTPPTGPYYAGVSTWYNYTPDADCWTSSGAVTTTNLSCVGDPGLAYGSGFENKIFYSFPINPGDPVLQNWSADAFIEFNDPNDNWANQIEIIARVVRGGTTYIYTLFHHNGTMGDLNGCLRKGGSFSATTGDSVTIEVKAAKYHSNVTIQSTRPFIFTTYP